MSGETSAASVERRRAEQRRTQISMRTAAQILAALNRRVAAPRAGFDDAKPPPPMCATRSEKQPTRNLQPRGHRREFDAAALGVFARARHSAAAAQGACRRSRAARPFRPARAPRRAGQCRRRRRKRAGRGASSRRRMLAAVSRPLAAASTHHGLFVSPAAKTQAEPARENLDHAGGAPRSTRVERESRGDARGAQRKAFRRLRHSPPHIRRTFWWERACANERKQPTLQTLSIKPAVFRRAAAPSDDQLRRARPPFVARSSGGRTHDARLREPTREHNRLWRP